MHFISSIHYLRNHLLSFLFQNKILLNHLEALHIKLAEKERGNTQIFLGNSRKDNQEDTDIQVVISYLRRSKEIVSIVAALMLLCLYHLK